MKILIALFLFVNVLQAHAACSASSSPSSIDFGNVALGVNNRYYILLSNDGDTNLVVESIEGISYPIDSIEGIVPGTVITKGNKIQIKIYAALINYTDTTIIFTIHFKSNCPSPLRDTVYISATYSNPVNTGHVFDSILVGKSILDSIVAANLGSIPLTLERMDIIDQNSQFKFENGTQNLMVNKFFKPGVRANFHVLFSPTILGRDTAVLRVTWDSACIKKLFSTNILIGYGIAKNEISIPSTDNSFVKIFNSAGKQITVSNKGVGFRSVKIQIVSLLGNEILSWQGTIDQNFEKTFSVQTSGLYYIIVETDDEKYFYKRLI